MEVGAGRMLLWFEEVWLLGTGRSAVLILGSDAPTIIPIDQIGRAIGFLTHLCSLESSFWIALGFASHLRKRFCSSSKAPTSSRDKFLLTAGSWNRRSII